MDIASLYKEDKEQEKKANRMAILAIFLYLTLIFILFFVIKLAKPIVEEEGMGLLVDFGYTDVGLGDEEPDSRNPLSKVSIPQPGNPPLIQTIKEKVIVQDEEETAEIDATNDKNTKKVLVENILKTDNTKKNFSENPSDKAPVTDAKPQVNDAALFKGFKGTGSGSGSQGNKEGEGNMGDLSGSKSDIYTGHSTGLGSEGEGRGRIGSGLVGRKLNSIPNIVDNSNKKGKVIIKVKVNDQGKVISSEYSAQGSTITDSDIISKCEQAALKAKFTASDSKDVDYGTLIFTFIVR